LSSPEPELHTEAADDDGCATLGRLPQILEDLLLGRGAHSREQVGSVRNRDLGVAQEGPGQGDLLLPSYAKVSRCSRTDGSAGCRNHLSQNGKIDKNDMENINEIYNSHLKL
jgi:hypothetical protein